MCENASWCDGTKSDYYDDDYFKKNGVENPFGDSNIKNRKCNTVFGQQSSLCMLGAPAASAYPNALATTNDGELLYTIIIISSSSSSIIGVFDCRHILFFLV